MLRETVETSQLNLLPRPEAAVVRRSAFQLWAGAVEPGRRVCLPHTPSPVWTMWGRHQEVSHHRTGNPSVRQRLRQRLRQRQRYSSRSWPGSLPLRSVRRSNAATMVIVRDEHGCQRSYHIDGISETHTEAGHVYGVEFQRKNDFNPAVLVFNSSPKSRDGTLYLAPVLVVSVAWFIRLG